jgi:hypothetical protein
VLLACVSSNVCSKTFAEEQVMIESVIQNEPINFFELYKWQILSVITLRRLMKCR